MRRILCLLIAAVIVLSLSACKKNNKKGDSGETATGDEISTGSSGDTTDETTNAGHEVFNIDFIEEFDQSPVMDGEQIIYDREDVTITATELKYNPADGPQIQLTIKNRSETDLRIQSEYAVVNGYMIRPDVDIDAPHRKTVKKPMTLSYLSLAMAGIDTLREVRFSLRLIDAETSGLFDVTDMIALDLDDSADDDQIFNEEGQTAFDDKGVKIVLKGVKNDNSFDSERVLLVYMYNGTGKTISVGNNRLSVNGYSITHTMQTILLPGTHAVDYIELFDVECDAKGIDTVETVDVSFRIFEYDEWKLLAETDKIPLQMD